MILGLSIHEFTELHVIISLVGIGSGVYVIWRGVLQRKVLPIGTAIFLITTLLTSATGFLFPISGFTPALGVGVVSLVTLAVAIVALARDYWGGAARSIYAASVTAALYLNVFVALAQAFQKLPALHALAPTGTEPSFVVAQGALLIVFVVLGISAVRHFRSRRLQENGSGATAS